MLTGAADLIGSNLIATLSATTLKITAIATVDDLYPRAYKELTIKPIFSASTSWGEAEKRLP